MLEFNDIQLAYDNIKDDVKLTPLIECPMLNEMFSSTVYLKLENLQSTGSFKLRGALNKIINLTPEEKSRGVIASSAGNHAQGVALGARKHNIKATIVMPETAPISKVLATKSYGADVVLHGDFYDMAYDKAMQLQSEYGYTFLHPFNDKYVIAGQGTIGIELFNQAPQLDIVFVQIGGGGLISGISLALKTLNPNIQIIGVEPIGASSMYSALENNGPVKLNSCSTIADGICVAKVGDITYDICSKYVDKIIRVSESQIANAIVFLLEKSKVVSEGAGACALAGLMSGQIDIKDKKVCALVSGGNIDINVIERIINKVQINQGRRLSITIYLNDTKGQVQEVTNILTQNGANILYLNQTRYNQDLEINEQAFSVVIECMDKQHADLIVEILNNKGFKVK